jgi:hypothetical protein
MGKDDQMPKQTNQNQKQINEKKENTRFGNNRISVLV